MHAHSRRRIVGLLLGVTLAMSVLGIAAAAYTPEKHDGVPKYYNSRVGYTDLGATVRIDSREFKGGRDGGAVRWRQQWIRDYVGGVLQVSHGPGSWATNIPLSAWFVYSGESHPTYSSTVTVNYRFEYEECNPGCYFWYAGDVLPINHVITP